MKQSAKIISTPWSRMIKEPQTLDFSDITMCIIFPLETWTRVWFFSHAIHAESADLITDIKLLLLDCSTFLATSEILKYKPTKLHCQ